MWFLVFVNIMFNAESKYNEPIIESWWEFETLEECYIARENLFVALGEYDGTPPSATQAVCIYKE